MEETVDVRFEDGTFKRDWFNRSQNKEERRKKKRVVKKA
jgi:hypothetical protein